MTRDQMLKIIWAAVRDTAKTPEDEKEVEELIADAESAMNDPDTNAKAIAFLDTLAANLGGAPVSKEREFAFAVAPFLRASVMGQVMDAYRKVHGL